MRGTRISDTLDVSYGTLRNEKIDQLRLHENVNGQVRYLRRAKDRFNGYYPGSCQSKVNTLPLVTGLHLQYAWTIVEPSPVSMYRRQLWVPLHREVFAIVDGRDGSIVRHRLINTWDCRATHDATVDKTVLVVDEQGQWREDYDQARKARLGTTVPSEGSERDFFEVLLSEMVTTMELAEQQYFGSVSRVPLSDGSYGY